MLNKIFVILCLFFLNTSFVEAEDIINDNVSAESIKNFETKGSLFEQITNLEQDKLIMQLKKEKAQLDLDLSRLEAEKIRLSKEIDNLKEETTEKEKLLEEENKNLENEISRLEKEKQELLNNTNKKFQEVNNIEVKKSIKGKYKVVELIGVNNELQATIHNFENGQKLKISVGKKIEDFVVSSISLDEGVVLKNGDITEILDIIKN